MNSDTTKQKLPVIRTNLLLHHISTTNIWVTGNSYIISAVHALYSHMAFEFDFKIKENSLPDE
tara:strand:+ start:410 stop:598 length:189 start_codon:yes stop_codon:yes gene_type:complete